MDVQPVKIGDAVWYTDHVGTRHLALVNGVWGEFGNPGSDPHGTVIPCLNLVYVSGDEAKSDTYGRQIERDTSVVHRSAQAAHGNFWENA